MGRDAKLPVVVLGGGGHAKVVIDALLAMNRQVLGYVLPEGHPVGAPLLGVPCLGDESRLTAWRKTAIELALGIGGTGDNSRRAAAFCRLRAGGYAFATLLHPSAYVAREVKLGQGCQLMAGAIIQPGATLGDDVIVNTRASIDHDCQLGDHVHIAPGAVLSGGVIVGHSAHIGTGATIVQGRTVSPDVLLAAGATLTRDALVPGTYRGVPARPSRPHDQR